MRYLIGPAPPAEDGTAAPTWTEMPQQVRRAYTSSAPRPLSIAGPPRSAADAQSTLGTELRAGSTGNVGSYRRPFSFTSPGEEAEPPYRRVSPIAGSLRTLSLAKSETEEMQENPTVTSTLREGRLFLRKGTAEYKPFHFVLTPTHLIYFSDTNRAASGFIELGHVKAMVLKAATDYTIELTCESYVAHLLTEPHTLCEEWFASILSQVNPSIRDRMVPKTVEIIVPALNERVVAPVTVLTRVRELYPPLAALLEKANTPVKESSICLRRNERVIWLDDDDLVLSSPVVFKSHVIECRPQAHRHAMKMDARVPPPDDIVGFLKKQGTDGVVRTWKRRWCFTRGENLFYVKSPRNSGDDLASDADGFINLESAQVIEVDVRNATVFDIGTALRTFRLEANSPEDAALWVACLRKISLFYQRHRQTHVTPWLHMEIKLDSARETVAARKEGTLLKRGYLNTSYKSRYCILADNVLTYYEIDDDNQHRKGNIPLSKALVAANDAEGEEAFSIITPSRVYSFKASTKALAEEWLVALRHEQQASARSAA